ncbi:GEGP motif-containing diheme protein [Desulforhopalus singaporensis]|uniref:Cytochrome c domain-containing protein n=1 Tax=Desulforhopalus singaporensis TaxID=91360 RepID=A0A1H0SRE3_9BACT|nr:GEGP motif-containing diheme protein [Desulforhopalus singaporensis]SDP43776.1 hypothetical protein SAMN05660330_02765 [Desulforhopalus singaporensis]
MKSGLWKGIICFFLLPLSAAYGAYHHGGDTDSDIVLQVYPEIEGTKLDSCALCHSGGQYQKKPGVFVELGSCQWCHYSYGYDESGDIDDTLNGYGVDYKNGGKNFAALTSIENLDSDSDGYTNSAEINAFRFPGDSDDDPTKVPAPYVIISRDELEAYFPYHEQTMLMNTHKSGDFYTTYGGVPVADLLDAVKIRETATGITVFAPDGWAQYHPLYEDSDPLMYHVYGQYPQVEFYYNEQADVGITDEGWCDYSAPGLENLVGGEPIHVENGLQMMLAYVRAGSYLDTGELTEANKLDGEGPFRLVPPQKNPGPPDQRLSADDQEVIWPFGEDMDHNAGFSTRSATIIRVEPLPKGTTDIDILEAGWNYVDDSKILIYGALDPLKTILGKLTTAEQIILESDIGCFHGRSDKKNLLQKIKTISKSLEKGHEQAAAHQLESLLWKIDGCVTASKPDANDWISDCDTQSEIYWLIHEARILRGDF